MSRFSGNTNLNAPGKRLRGLVPLAAVLLLSPLASAQISLTTRPGAATGYDSNIYYGAGALPDDVDTYDGAYLGVTTDTELLADLGSHYLTLMHQLDMRQMITAQESTGKDGKTKEQAHETLLSQQVVLGYLPPPLWNFYLMVAVGLNHMYLRNFDEGGWLTGLGMLKVSRPMGSAWLSLAYILDYTDYNSGSSASSEITHRILAAVSFSPHKRLKLEPGYILSLVRADPEEYSSISHQIGLSAWWDTPVLPLKVEAGYDLVIYTMAVGSQGQMMDPLGPYRPGDGTGPYGPRGPRGPRSPGGPPPDAPGRRLDLVHVPRAAVSWRASKWLDVGLTWKFMWGKSNLDQVEDYSRHQVMASATFRWEAGGMAPPRLTLPRDSSRPEVVLRVTHLDRDARAVALVGSFNDWDPAKTPMLKHEETWSAELEPPPGLHQYMIWVDGEILAPQDCGRWMADGFGGRNCVFFRGGPKK